MEEKQRNEMNLDLWVIEIMISIGILKNEAFQFIHIAQNLNCNPFTTTKLARKGFVHKS